MKLAILCLLVVVAPVALAQVEWEMGPLAVPPGDDWDSAGHHLGEVLVVNGTDVDGVDVGVLQHLADIGVDGRHTQSDGEGHGQPHPCPASAQLSPGVSLGFHGVQIGRGNPGLEAACA